MTPHKKLIAIVLTSTALVFGQPAGWKSIANKPAHRASRHLPATRIAEQHNSIVGTWKISGALDENTTLDGLITFLPGEGPDSGPAILTTNQDQTLPYTVTTSTGNWTRTGLNMAAVTTLGFMVDATNSNQPIGTLKITHTVTLDGDHVSVKSHIEVPGEDPFDFEWAGARVAVEQ